MHVIININNYIWYKKLPENVFCVMITNGPQRPTAIGNIKVKFFIDKEIKQITLINTLYMPSFPVKIFNNEIFFAKSGTLNCKNDVMLFYTQAIYMVWINKRIVVFINRTARLLN